MACDCVFKNALTTAAVTLVLIVVIFYVLGTHTERLTATVKSGLEEAAADIKAAGAEQSRATADRITAATAALFK